MHQALRIPALTLFAATLLVPILPIGTLAAQEPAKPPVTWPTLTKAQTERAITLFRTLTLDDEEARDKAEVELLAIGSGIAPLALKRLVDSKPNHNARMTAVLDRLTTREHTPLLARFVKDTRAAARSYAVLRLAQFRDPDLSPVFISAADDKDKEVAFHAALGSLALSDFRGFDLVLKRAVEDWTASSGRIASTLHGSGNEAASLKLLERLAKAEVRQAVGCLRLFRYLGVKEAAVTLKHRLDSEDFGVKKETINALRAVVDGAPPLEDLSVFRAIEVAKEWQARL